MTSRIKLFVSVSSVVFLVLVGIAALFLAPVITKSNISASELLSNAQSQTAQVKSYKFTINAQQTEGETTYKTFTESAVVFGEGMHVITRVEGVPLTEGGYQESLLLLGKEYVRTRPDGEWKASDSNFDPNTVPVLDPQDHFRLVDELSESEVLGEEDVNGVPSRKIRGNVDLTLKAQKIWGNNVSEAGADHRDQFLAGSEELTVWVGIEDNFIRAYELKGAFPSFKSLPPVESWYRTELSNFNEPLELPKP